MTASSGRRPAEVAADIRGRLRVLRDAARVLRLGSAGDDPYLLAVIRLVEQHVGSLARLADEVERLPGPGRN